jgi:hypothetical protein
MKLSDLTSRRALTLRLHAPELPPQLAPDTELRLVEEAPGRWVARVGELRLAVVPAGEDQGEVLSALDPAGASVLSWVAVVDRATKPGLLVVSVVAFHDLWQPGTPLALGVDEAILEKIGKFEGRHFGLSAAIPWLEARFLLPGPSGRRMVITGESRGSNGFRVHGRGYALDVVTVDGRLAVTALVKRRHKQAGIAPRESLVCGDLSFVDMTLAASARAFVEGAARALTASSDRSYARLWQEYQHLEEGLLKRRSEELGWIGYDRVEERHDGRFRFHLAGKDGPRLERFIAGLDEVADLQATRRAPVDSVPGAQDVGATSRGRFVGHVRDYDHTRRYVDLTPLSQDSESQPPDKGFLHLALAGDGRRLERRDQALARMVSGDAPNKYLLQLIEGHPIPARTRPRLDPLSAAVRGLFSPGPTASQREAIDVAINTPDIALIQGPPGTGKTTVIAAILMRLMELDEGRDGRAHGRTLLSSFQHDALDNAIDRAPTGHLPPARFGGRAGRRSDREQLETWRIATTEKVRANIASLPEDRPRAEYWDFLRRAARYSAGREAAGVGRRIVDGLLALAPSPFSVEALSALEQARTPPIRLPDSDPARRNFERLIRRLPETPGAIDGDAPTHAELLLERHRDRLPPHAVALLSTAAESDARFSEVAEAVLALRVRLLAELSGAPQPDEPHDVALVEPLRLALSDWRAHLDVSRSGVADALEDYLEALSDSTDSLLDMLRAYAPVYAATCQQAVGRDLSDLVSDGAGVSFENVIVDEAARANPLDLFIPMSLGSRRIILVGDHRQLPHMLEPEVERVLDDRTDPTLSETLRQSLFERLFVDLRAREQTDGIRRVVTLDQQFRMHPVLGRFVSDIFYLPWKEGFASPRPAEDFAHDVAKWMRQGRAVPAVWEALPVTRGEARREGSSWMREVEADRIATRCKELLEQAGSGRTVGVITFYSAQVNAILRAMKRLGLVLEVEDGRLAIDERVRWGEAQGRRVERLRVGTVDAFQGMEFDVVLLSVVRSERSRPSPLAEGEEASPSGLEGPARSDPAPGVQPPGTASRGRGQLTPSELARRRFGHLTLANRLCVAMSRQKRVLVAVGDAAMFDDELAREHVPGLHAFLKLCRSDDGLVT